MISFPVLFWLVVCFEATTYLPSTMSWHGGCGSKTAELIVATDGRLSLFASPRWSYGGLEREVERKIGRIFVLIAGFED